MERVLGEGDVREVSEGEEILFPLFFVCLFLMMMYNVV